MIIYQMLPRLWGNGTLQQIDDQCLEYFKTLGVTHVWYTGIIRHSTGKPYVKGNPGSPYSICDYYDVNPYLSSNPDARMQDFEALVKRTHDQGLGVIIDYVPNHVSPDYSDAHGSIETCGYYDYDWSDTLKVDYSRRSNWEKMRDILLFWASKGVDGFRCDMVEMVPPEYMKWLISEVKRQYPKLIFIAEVYTRERYRRYVHDVGFDLLYDKSGLYDILKDLMEGRGNARKISWNWQFLQDLQPRMLNFLENHDEPRMPEAYPALFVSLLLNRAPFMLYFGEEIGEAAADTKDHRTSIFNKITVPSLQRLYTYIHTRQGLEQKELETLNRFRRLMAEAPDWGETYDLVYCNMDTPGFKVDSHYIWMRISERGTFLLGANFTKEKADISVFIPGYTSRINISIPPMGGNILKL
ncbi:MAG: hypothetical protein II172_05650 [Bacteroidales bacterium]|nr:hypothetical protein [Bacteroidales bacterium]